MNKKIEIDDMIFEWYPGQNSPQPIHVTHEKNSDNLEWRIYPHIGGGDSPEYFFSKRILLNNNIYLKSDLDKIVNYLQQWIDEAGGIDQINEHHFEMLVRDAEARINPEYFDIIDPEKCGSSLNLDLKSSISDDEIKIISDEIEHDGISDNIVFVHLQNYIEKRRNDALDAGEENFSC